MHNQVHSQQHTAETPAITAGRGYDTLLQNGAVERDATAAPLMQSLAETTLLDKVETPQGEFGLIGIIDLSAGAGRLEVWGGLDQKGDLHKSGVILTNEGFKPEALNEGGALSNSLTIRHGQKVMIGRSGLVAERLGEMPTDVSREHAVLGLDEAGNLHLGHVSKTADTATKLLVAPPPETLKGHEQVEDTAPRSRTGAAAGSLSVSTVAKQPHPKALTQTAEDMGNQKKEATELQLPETAAITLEGLRAFLWDRRQSGATSDMFFAGQEEVNRALKAGQKDLAALLGLTTAGSIARDPEGLKAMLSKVEGLGSFSKEDMTTLHQIVVDLLPIAYSSLPPVERMRSYEMVLSSNLNIFPLDQRKALRTGLLALGIGVTLADPDLNAAYVQMLNSYIAP